jgi:DNA-binding LytR/AlgR family response regulator
MKVVIIEDEVQTAKALEKLLRQHDIEVMTVIASIEEGIAYFQEGPEVDLIFSDIEIADGLCFDIFKEVTITCPIIFCTAFNQYALEAFRTNGIDYIVKPFTPKSISDAIGKYNLLTKRERPIEKVLPATTDKEDLYNLLKTTLSRRKSTLLVSFRDKTFPVNLNSIAYFFVEDETTLLYTEGKEYTLSKSLEEIEVGIDAAQFFRANRQYLINRDFIKEIEKFFARKLVIKLTVPVREPIVVSKAKATEFMTWLEQ